MAERKYRIIEIEWPDFGTCKRPEPASAEEYSIRIKNLRDKMERAGLSHLVVYANREHFANLAWLTEFDPRLVEALLILGFVDKPLLLVGNECENRLNISPLFTAGDLRGEHYQPFSLLDQPKGESRTLRDIFSSEGIDGKSAVGCAGWKYFSEKEQPDAKHAIEIPGFIVDILRDLAGKDRVVNATALIINPENGLRTSATADDIAYFEFIGILASEGMKNILFHMEDGMCDYDLGGLSLYNGEPQGAHFTFTTGGYRHIGLSGPMGTKIRSWEPFSSNICYWGSNSCRACWVASTATDLSPDARDYVENFAGLYFEAMYEWFSWLRIGTPGGKLAALIERRLPFEKFGIFLNPRHLIHLDECLSSPIFSGSEIQIRSGMVMQADVIPSSPVYFSTCMEYGYVVADCAIRERLKGQFPDCYSRCQDRRRFMIDTLEIELPEEILPISNIPAIVPPFFLNPNLVFAMGN